MKIALANNLYYPYNRGGAETVIKKMVTDLRAQNHEVILFTLHPKKDAPLEKIRISTEDGIKIYRLASNYFRLAEFNPLKKIFWHLGNIFSWEKTAAIKKILIEEKPELIITHNLMGLGFQLPRAIKKLNIHHEHYLHDIQLLHPSGLMMFGEEWRVDSFSAKIYQHFTRNAFNSPAKVISPSDWLLKEHLKRGFFKDSTKEVKKSNIIEDKTAISQRENNLQPTKNFLFVGQIEDHKGIILLVATFKKALRTKPDIYLTIAGDGSLLEEAKKIAKKNTHIEFRGRVDNSEIKSLMATSAYLIVPSLCYENSPTTIYEAHSVGLPVIAANIGGIPEIIKAGDRLFQPGDIDDLVKNILN
jgi:glycosyltransferase involved in cell wall biosynthesis